MSINAVTPKASTFADWIRPSVIVDEAGKLFTSLDGVDDGTEAIVNIAEWLHELTGSETAENFAESFETINRGLAVPGFINSGGKFVDSCREGKPVEIFENGMKTVNKATKSAMFFDDISVVSLKESLKFVKGVFWGSLFCVDALSISKQYDKVQKYVKKAKEADKPAEKGIFEHKVNIAYLTIVKSVNSIALACIALVSILFVSIAHGIIFSPLVFLSLTSTWLVLNFFTHFYEKMVDVWAKEIKPQASVGAAVGAQT